MTSPELNIQKAYLGLRMEHGFEVVSPSNQLGSLSVSLVNMAGYPMELGWFGDGPDNRLPRIRNCFALIRMPSDAANIQDRFILGHHPSRAVGRLEEQKSDVTPDGPLYVRGKPMPGSEINDLLRGSLLGAFILPSAISDKLKLMMNDFSASTDLVVEFCMDNVMNGRYVSAIEATTIERWASYELPSLN